MFMDNVIKGQLPDSVTCSIGYISQLTWNPSMSPFGVFQVTHLFIL